LLLLSLRRVADTGDARRRTTWAVGAALVYGMSLLAGFPMLMVYVSVGLACYFAADLGLRAGMFRRYGTLSARGALALSGAFVVIVVVGAFVAAAMLLPALQFTDLSTRAREYGAPDTLSLQGAPDLLPGTPWRVFKALVTYPGIEGFNISGRSMSAGVIPVLLALAALAHPRRRQALPYLVLFYVLFDCGRGRPFPIAALVTWAMPMKESVPDHTMVVLSLPLGICAGFGVDALARGMVRGRGRVALAVLLGGTGVLGLTALGPFGDPTGPVRLMHTAVPAIATLATVLALWVRAPRVWPPVLACLVYAEIFLWVPLTMPRQWTTFPGTLADLRGQRTFWGDNRRGVEPIWNQNMYDLRASIDGYDPLHLARVYKAICSPDKESEYSRWVTHEAARTNLRWNLFLKRPFWLTRQWVRGPLPPKDRPFPPTTTVFLEDASLLPVPELPRDDVPASGLSADTTLAFAAALADAGPSRDETNGLTLTLPPFEVPERHSVFCLRYHCVGEVAVRINLKGARAIGHLPDFVMRSTPPEGAVAALPLPDVSPVRAKLTFEPRTKGTEWRLEEVSLVRDDADEDDRIGIVSRSANRVEVRLDDLPDDRILVFVDAYFPGWEARVDGESVPIHLANDAFKAVVVPGGAHTVVFTYHSWRLSTGLWVANFTLIVCCGSLIHCLVRRRTAVWTVLPAGSA
jgi:hypothetical protein